jgi:hypothetical protein
MRALGGKLHARVIPAEHVRFIPDLPMACVYNFLNVRAWKRFP